MWTCQLKMLKKSKTLSIKCFKMHIKIIQNILKLHQVFLLFPTAVPFLYEVLSKRNVCFFSGLVKGRYIATNMYKQRNTLVWNNYHAKLFIPSMHQGILAQLICFWNFCGMKPLKLFLGYTLIFVRRRFHCFHSSIWSHKWCALTSA